MIVLIIFVFILILSTIIVDEYITRYIFDLDNDKWTPDHGVVLTENNETILFYIGLNNTAFSKKYRDKELFYKAEQGYFA